MLILGLETSCDETGVALYDAAAERLLGHAVHSQVDMHEACGGVVPELASRDHVRRLVALARNLLAKAGCRPRIYRKTPIAAVSPSTVADLVSKGIPAENLSIVTNCVDHSLYRVTGEPKSPVPLVGYLGRIKKYERIDHLVRAFAVVRRHLPNAELVILGERDARPGLEQLAEDLGVRSAVRFTGFIDEEEKVRQLGRMHVVANPSARKGGA